MEEVIARLRQRKIVQWSLAYLAAAFALIQMLDLIGQRFGWPDWIARATIVAAAVCASIGAIGESTSSWNAPSPASPSRIAARATAPTSFAYISARRTGTGVRPAAAASASVMTPSSAPWRSSPTRSRITNSRSGSVARAKRRRSASVRSAFAPAPRMTAISASVRSTSAIMSEGSAAGATSLAARNIA